MRRTAISMPALRAQAQRVKQLEKELATESGKFHQMVKDFPIETDQSSPFLADILFDGRVRGRWPSEIIPRSRHDEQMADPKSWVHTAKRGWLAAALLIHAERSL